MNMNQKKIAQELYDNLKNIIPEIYPELLEDERSCSVNINLNISKARKYDSGKRIKIEVTCGTTNPMMDVIIFSVRDKKYKYITLGLSLIHI